jgi:Homeodomain
MNEESYCSDDDCDNESASESNNGPENMKMPKKIANRQYIANGDSQNMERIIRKRKRKSTDQLKILMREFDKNPNWSKETLLEVSRKTGLSEA